MSAKILLVDDDRFLNGSIAKLLTSEGYVTRSAFTAEEGYAMVESEAPDLAILDVGLGEQDGYGLCRRIRTKWTFPILMLTARADLVDKVIGLEVGADDYLTKPFQSSEFVARVRALLRRSQQYVTPVAQTSDLKIGNLVIDPDRRDASVDGKWLGLKNKEFELLSHMAANQGRVLSREALFSYNWGYDISFNSNSLDVYIYRLRKKIESDPEKPVYLHTLRGYGYKLEYAPH
ncbi:response regulator YycF [soil metagenome]